VATEERARSAAGRTYSAPSARASRPLRALISG
jgi:hypothetical protein